MSSEIKMWSDPFWNLRDTSKILKDMHWEFPENGGYVDRNA
jgi:hypothetical protein